MSEYVKSEISTNEYEPFMLGDKQAGEVHWLTTTNSNNEVTYSGLWRCEPMTFEYEFPGDEYIQVLQGNLFIVIPGQDNIELKKGDIAAFNKGLKTTWTVQNSFQKFFVISNC